MGILLWGWFIYFFNSYSVPKPYHEKKILKEVKKIKTSKKNTYIDQIVKDTSKFPAPNKYYVNKI